jgi:hypothetical protein
MLKLFNVALHRMFEKAYMLVKPDSAVKLHGYVQTRLLGWLFHFLLQESGTSLLM